MDFGYAFSRDHEYKRTRILEINRGNVNYIMMQILNQHSHLSLHNRMHNHKYTNAELDEITTKNMWFVNCNKCNTCKLKKKFLY